MVSSQRGRLDYSISLNCCSLLLGWGEEVPRGTGCYLLLETTWWLRQVVVPRGVSVEEAMALKGGAERILPSCVHCGPSVLSELSVRLPVLLVCQDNEWGGKKNWFPVIAVSKIIIESIYGILTKCLVSAKHFTRECWPGLCSSVLVVVFHLRNRELC